MTASPPEPALPHRIVLYDGVCGLCHRSVRWLVARDHARALSFAPLQGDTAAVLRRKYPEIPDNLDTVVYIEGERVHLRSKAFLYVSRHLTRPWRWLYRVRWLPGWLLDLGYRLVACVRYRVFGKYDACRLPTEDERARFLP